MPKFIDFLEKNVQWLALGLGGLFLVWMVYLYVLTPPVVVELDGQQAGPVEVADKTQQVVDQIEKKQRVETKLTDPPDFAAAFTDKITHGVEVANLPSSIVPTFPVDTGGPIRKGGTEPETPIKSLPTLAAANPTDMSKGYSVASVPDASKKPDPADPAAANAMPVMMDRETNWVTVRAEINWKRNADEFRKHFQVAGIDPQRLRVLTATMFLDVSLERREKKADGTWTDPAPVPHLTKIDRPPFPDAKASDQEIQIFLSAVGQQSEEVMRPTFYDVTAGDPWYPPGEEGKAKLVGGDAAAAPFDPSVPGAKPRNADEMRQLAAYKQRQKAAGKRTGAGGPYTPGAAAGSSRNTYSTAGAGATNKYGAYGRGGSVPNGAYNPAGGGAARGSVPNAYPPGYGRGGRGFRPDGLGEGKFDALLGPTAGNGQNAGGGMGAFGQPVGGGAAAPGQGDEEVSIWAHDETVQPGKTYQYRIRYALLNPVYRQSGAAPAELVHKFALISPWSEWTEPVTIQPKVDFYIASIPTTGGPTQIDLFTIKPGGVNKTTIRVNPGDAIADTGWTVVDVRKDPVANEPYLLLTHNSGQVVRRDKKTDERNPQYQKYLEQAGTGGGLPAVAGR